MKAYGELRSYKAKALVSGDKSIEVKIYIIANNFNKIDVNELQALLHEPLEVELNKSDKPLIEIITEAIGHEATTDSNATQDPGRENL